MTEIAVAVSARCKLGETPLWCSRTRRLWWLDIEAPALNSFDPARAAHRSYPLPGRFAGTLALRESGGVALGLGGSLYTFEPETGDLALVAEVARRADHRLNDGRAVPGGHFFIGTMHPTLREPVGGFWRVSPDRSVTLLRDDLIVPNGMAVSPDGRLLTLGDTRRHTLWAFDLDPADGALANQRVLVDATAAPGRPDGACFDADGCLWVAFYAGGRLVRHTPDGRVDRVVELPVAYPTCLAFGGDDLATLYVTSASAPLAAADLAHAPLAGALLALDVGVKGVPERRVGF